ncbi:hypothetical protein RUM44_010729 [Polyplax serrata]|uniref:Uncharacterized protein n=1 Tax=Polyplax serrata TaxID=468196 RepID=A0ABR1AN05_POLSC
MTEVIRRVFANFRITKIEGTKSEFEGIVEKGKAVFQWQKIANRYSIDVAADRNDMLQFSKTTDPAASYYRFLVRTSLNESILERKESWDSFDVTETMTGYETDSTPKVMVNEGKLLLFVAVIILLLRERAVAQGNSLRTGLYIRPTRRFIVGMMFELRPNNPMVGC